MVCFEWRYCEYLSVVIGIFYLYLHDKADRRNKGEYNGN